MSILKNPRWEAFCQEYARNGNGTQSYIKAGFSESSAGTGSYNLLKNEEIQARIEELKSSLASELDKVMDFDITKRLSRVKKLHEYASKIETLFAERAIEYADAPGGKTGLVVLAEKHSGGKLIREYQMDAATYREYRATLQQAAQELGQWTEKNENVNKWSGDLGELTPEQLKKVMTQMEEAAFGGDEEARAAALKEVESDHSKAK